MEAVENITNTEKNAYIIDQDIQWLSTIIKNRIFYYLDPNEVKYYEPEAPDILSSKTYYARFIENNKLTNDERKVVLLALIPEIKPEILDPFLIRNQAFDKIFTEFGGVFSSTFNGFIPTIKTALFLLGGDNLNDQMKYVHLFEKSNTLFRRNILKEIEQESINPTANRPLCLNPSALSYITTGEDIHYEYSSDFPANKLTTLMEWEDLVLCELTSNGLKEILAWADHGNEILYELDMNKNIQAGYRSLFYGPSGTGKTLCAALFGKKVGKPVYRIDLSQIVSKYIGETEKNLENVFRLAENYDWILFFDEADALFGKRTSITSSNDRFANQETAYLLQRFETCKNIVILATNLKVNLDEAFTRRFQSIVYFPMPEAGERLRLWNGAFSEKVILDDKIDLQQIAEKYEFTGGNIVNIVRYTTLMALSRNTVFISYQDIIEGIRREYGKQGRTL